MFYFWFLYLSVKLFSLQDIVMPKLDGVSATSLIRKFDHMTPIISMTSNSKPNEIMTYYSSGTCSSFACLSWRVDFHRRDE